MTSLARPMVGGLACAALAAACRRSPPPSDLVEPPAASTSASPEPAVGPPADHLAPGELVEGPKRAFGVALPRGAEVKGAFVDVVYATAPASVHALTQYFRPRLESGTLREAYRSATFDHVQAKGSPGTELVVRILAAQGGANVEVRDTTPAPAVALPDDAARWKQVGLTPDGHLADPRHLD